MSDLENRLKEFLSLRGQQLEFDSLTADASTREYFRVNWNGSKAIDQIAI